MQLPPMFSLKQILKIYGIDAQRHLGQNFLLKANILGRD